MPESPAIADLPSQYDHQAAQSKWYKVWEDRGYFHAEADSDKPPYTIVIPPPNVTGALHLGHALNNTLQDILIRMKRMQGFNTLWMPGTDHAGIATQAVVERRLLEEEKLSRHDLGREGLVARIWTWKEQYEKRIISQLKQLGCSCDWARTQFTFNEHNSRAVRETFFRLFKDGKIYRGKRLVNWDTYLQTAVSDDEVFHEPTKGSFWHFKYPVIDPKPGEPTHVTIATTRPETMLGDTAVAVHPDPAKAFNKASADLRERILIAAAKEKADLEKEAALLLERRAKMLPLLEKLCDMADRKVRLRLPLTDRDIPLIKDEWAKPELGTGCVKITPAHDENDYAVYQRRLNLEPWIGIINIMRPDGRLGEGEAGDIPTIFLEHKVPEKYRNLTMRQARDEVVKDMERAGFYDPATDREDREIDLAHSDRSKTPIEPYLADQWFVEMDELAQSAMDAVKDGRVKIVPERYAKSYLDWLSEKRDWPVGRQLWWGHRIPAWNIEFVDAAHIPKYSELEEYVEPETRHDAAKALIGTYLKSEGIPAAEFGFWSPKDALDPTLFVCGQTERVDAALKVLSEYLVHRRETAEGTSKSANWPRVFETTQISEELFGITQDEEVLDTWFSSALWPHSTLGWPDQTPELATFYPTTALLTGRDIISLWVARMVLTGLFNTGDVPFREVYIHPKILDGYGESMNKSKGNGVDPLDVIEKFGADALRYGLAYLTTETQDVKMPVEFECPHCQHLMAQTKKNRTLPRVDCEKCGQPFSTQWAEKPDDKALPRAGISNERFELGRRFANKLWNASRFSFMNLAHKAGDGIAGPDPGDTIAGSMTDANLLLEDRWILSRLNTVTREVTDALEHYRFAEAARALYEFAWNDFCDYYVEITKARFKNDAQRPAAQRLLAHVLDSLLRLLHPITPFLTEEVWQLLNQVAPERGLPAAATTAEHIVIAPWPTVDEARIDPTIEEQFADFQAVLGAVREIRMAQNIPPRTPIEFRVCCDAATGKLIEPMCPYFAQIAEAACTALGPEVKPPERAVSKSLGDIEVHVDVSAFFDPAAEKVRLAKEVGQLRGLQKSIEAKLANENFVTRAPAEVVQQQRAKLTELAAQIASADAALAKLP